MTALLHREESVQAQIVPQTRWVCLTNTYICRTTVTSDAKDQGFVATAIRVPGLVGHGKSKDEAVKRVERAFLSIMKRQPAPKLTPMRDISLAELSTAIDLCVVVDDHLPSVRDIDAVYDEVELTDEEADELNAQRASGSARPTIPLVRFHRP